MKIKENYVLQQVAGTWVVMPVGEEVLKFNGMMTLNEVGVLLWRALEQDTTLEALADALTGEYTVTREHTG